MDDIDKAAGPPKKSRKHAAPASPSHQLSRPDRLAVTLDANTGEIIQIESIDATGTRHELSKDETISLAKENGQAKLEELLEQAFEAGIACVLGGEDEPEESQEAKGDAELRQILLKPLIEESSAARLMRSEVLDRAIVETLLYHSLNARSQGPEGSHPKGSPPKEPDQDRAAPKTN